MCPAKFDKKTKKTLKKVLTFLYGRGIIKKYQETNEKIYRNKLMN